MQPDGTLNPSPTTKDTPDPSDSGASYWLARTVWALGEGYADFRHADPAFAAFLKDRLDLAIGALDREVLTRYGRYQVVDGVPTPAWLIVDGAGARAPGAAVRPVCSGTVSHLLCRCLCPHHRSARAGRRAGRSRRTR
jgi:hypothetical protein